MQVLQPKKIAPALAQDTQSTGKQLHPGDRAALEAGARPHTLLYRLLEPVLLLGKEQFARVELYVPEKGGDHTAQLYVVHQSVSKAISSEIVNEISLSSMTRPS